MRMHLRLPALLVAVGAFAVTSADNPTGTGNRFTNLDSKPELFAINGTLPAAFTGLKIRAQSPVPADPTFGFDLAFDLNATGDTVIVHTVRTIANQLVSVQRVGLQTTT